MLRRCTNNEINTEALWCVVEKHDSSKLDEMLDLYDPIYIDIPTLGIDAD